MDSSQLTGLRDRIMVYVKDEFDKVLKALGAQIQENEELRKVITQLEGKAKKLDALKGLLNG